MRQVPTLDGRWLPGLSGSRFRSSAVAAALFGVLVGACQSAPAPLTPHQSSHPHGIETSRSLDVHPQLTELRRATARFHDFEAARAAGYTVLFDPDGDGPGSACLSDPDQGAMGEHYVHPDLLFDGGALDAARPEALIYEPMPDGTYRFVGVEYVVPFSDVPVHGQPPVLFDQQFTPNDNPGFHLWALHVWAWEHNPSGMFAPWNPRVTCKYSTN